MKYEKVVPEHRLNEKIQLAWGFETFLFSEIVSLLVRNLKGIQ